MHISAVYFALLYLGVLSGELGKLLLTPEEI